MTKVKCPTCDAEFDIPNDVILGEIVSCPGCGLDFEVHRLEGEKVELKEAEVEGEDWGE